VLLALIFLGSAFLVMYLTLRGRSVEVPDVTGKTESEAMDVAGLRMKVTGRAASPRFEANLVSDQSPSVGTVVKTGQIVRVNVSTGLATPTPKLSSSPNETPTPTPTPSDE
jgi:beta-lactam-binding protein with PASTA domain